MTEHSKPKPVAFLGVTGEVFREFAQDGGQMYGTGAERAMPRSEVEQNHGPLTELYAHPPVTAEPARERNLTVYRVIANALVPHQGDKTSAAEKAGSVERALADAGYVVAAEPATAPSVEQIAEEVGKHHETYDEGKWYCTASSCDWEYSEGVGLPHAVFDAHRAEAIHALYGTPGGAGESTLGNAYAAEMEANDQAKHRIEELEALANRQAADASNKIATIRRHTEHIAHLRAEVQRHKAALEAAEALGWARDSLYANESALSSAQAGVIDARGLYQKRKEQYAAARAAVEAETSEEA